MIDQSQPAKMDRMVHAIMAAIETTGDSENLTVILGSLGAVTGCMARASQDPANALRAAHTIAQGIINGELLT